MRNSSLVEGSCAENLTGLKPVTEAVDAGDRVVQAGAREQSLQPAQAGLNSGMVGERSSGEEGWSRGWLERGEVRIPE